MPVQRMNQRRLRVDTTAHTFSVFAINSRSSVKMNSLFLPYIPDSETLPEILDHDFQKLP